MLLSVTSVDLYGARRLETKGELAVPYESRKQDLEMERSWGHPIHPSLSLGPVLPWMHKSLLVDGCCLLPGSQVHGCIACIPSSDIQPHTKVTRSDRSEASLKRSKSFTLEREIDDAY